MKRLKTFFLIYLAVLFMLIGYGAAKGFLNNLSPLEASPWFYLWPLLSSLFFAFGVLLILAFVRRIMRKS
jgi:amino acid permease